MASRKYKDDGGKITGLLAAIEPITQDAYARGWKEAISAVTRAIQSLSPPAQGQMLTGHPKTRSSATTVTYDQCVTDLLRIIEVGDRPSTFAISVELERIGHDIHLATLKKYLRRLQQGNLIKIEDMRCSLTEAGTQARRGTGAISSTGHKITTGTKSNSLVPPHSPAARRARPRTGTRGPDGGEPSPKTSFGRIIAILNATPGLTAAELLGRLHEAEDPIQEASLRAALHRLKSRKLVMTADRKWFPAQDGIHVVESSVGSPGGSAQPQRA
jgi:hypothetical protein